MDAIIISITAIMLYIASATSIYIWHERYGDSENFTKVTSMLFGAFLPPLCLALWLGVLFCRPRSRSSKPSRAVRKAEERVRLAELQQREAQALTARNKALDI
jgi:hypothetical protein